ncbi:hypothetical protein [Halobacillus trueperi]|uniref:Uncharacterized protein n=1 Tax=Halobacillus trueperi TaxID=156205 RepID=A0A3E0JDL5_9BACI|nr:hypothetical protein [Halobacillus trueperi]REJ11043.1 hypothetical protein DYE48_01185 [Halobacillus trueperi]
MIKSLLVLSLVLTPLHSNVESENPQPSDNCINLMKERDAKFKDRVFEDVISSSEYFNNYEHVHYFTSDDLSMINALLGKENTQIESLRKYFAGVAQGERRLYYVLDDPTHRAFMLYKNFSNENVMIELKRGEQGWEKVDKTVRKGKEIEMESLRCEEEFQLERLLNQIFSL